MKFGMHLVLALFLATLSTGSGAVVDTSPDVLAKNVTNDVLRIVKQDKDIKNGNRKKVQSLVEDKVLPIFDFRQMTQQAVGKNWSKATADQQQDLVAEFRTLLVRTYSSALASVSDYNIEFKPMKVAPGDDDVTINTEVSKPGAPPIPIDYRMAKQEHGWKVVDVKVEGASLVRVYRTTFDSEVRRGGIEGLLGALQRRNQKTAEGMR
ncbi:MAG: ABC transporter substrate-binding protein [Betaproteobacteria bacterium]|nr:ABC transporter substrate-binding protein [Betaproteobacteria bacterium]